MKRTRARFVSAISVAILMLASVSWLTAQTNPNTNTTDQATTGQKDQSDIEKRIRAAADVLNEVMAEKDKAILTRL